MTKTKQFVRCDWQNLSDELKQKSLGLVEHHAGHAAGNMGDCDAWVCVCGNTSSDSGFQPCDAQGNEVEPRPDRWPGDRALCQGCEVIIDIETGEILGRKKRARFLEALRDFTQAAIKLSANWDDDSCKGYPVNWASFDEEVYRIIEFREACEAE